MKSFVINYEDFSRLYKNRLAFGFLRIDSCDLDDYANELVLHWIFLIHQEDLRDFMSRPLCM